MGEAVGERGPVEAIHVGESPLAVVDRRVQASLEADQIAVDSPQVGGGAGVLEDAILDEILRVPAQLENLKADGVGLGRDRAVQIDPQVETLQAQVLLGEDEDVRLADGIRDVVPFDRAVADDHGVEPFPRAYDVVSCQLVERQRFDEGAVAVDDDLVPRLGREGDRLVQSGRVAGDGDRPPRDDAAELVGADVEIVVEWSGFAVDIIEHAGVADSVDGFRIGVEVDAIELEQTVGRDRVAGETLVLILGDVDDVAAARRSRSAGVADDAVVGPRKAEDAVRELALRARRVDVEDVRVRIGVHADERAVPEDVASTVVGLTAADRPRSGELDHAVGDYGRPALGVRKKRLAPGAEDRAIDEEIDSCSPQTELAPCSGEELAIVHRHSCVRDRGSDPRLLVVAAARPERTAIKLELDRAVRATAGTDASRPAVRVGDRAESAAVERRAQRGALGLKVSDGVVECRPAHGRHRVAPLAVVERDVDPTFDAGHVPVHRSGVGGVPEELEDAVGHLVDDDVAAASHELELIAEAVHGTQAGQVDAKVEASEGQVLVGEEKDAFLSHRTRVPLLGIGHVRPVDRVVTDDHRREAVARPHRHVRRQPVERQGLDEGTVAQEDDLLPFPDESESFVDRRRVPGHVDRVTSSAEQQRRDHNSTRQVASRHRTTPSPSSFVSSARSADP